MRSGITEERARMATQLASSTPSGAHVSPKRYASLAGLAACLAALTIAGCNPDPVQGSGEGARLFNYCAPCHGTDGHGNKKYGAPAIAGLSKWYVSSQLAKFKNGQRGAHPDDVEGLRMRPMMRILKNEKHIQAVAQYVSEMRPAHPLATINGGNAIRGKTLYGNTCTACHGPDARGNQQLKAPALIRSNDWYLLRQLHKFKNRVRGGLEPATLADGSQSPGQIMLQNVVNTPDQDMLDIVAYIAELAR